MRNAELYGVAFWSTEFANTDLRGAQYWDLSEANTQNAILSDGYVMGLELGFAERLVIRDDDPAEVTHCHFRGCWTEERSPTAITVAEQLVMHDGSLLQLAFDADTWDSTISMQSDIVVQLGGTLELTFTDGTDLASKLAAHCVSSIARV